MTSTADLIDELRWFVDAITYRAGWSFDTVVMPMSRVRTPVTEIEPISTRPIWDNALAVMITFATEDVRYPGVMTSLKSSFVLDKLWMGREYAFRELLFNVWEAISDIESHERMEMLKLEGKPIWNPHPNWRSDPSSFETYQIWTFFHPGFAVSTFLPERGVNDSNHRQE